MDLQAFGQRIRNMRKKRNLKVAQIAEALHVTRNTVYKWEEGESLPSIETAFKLAKLLNVSVDYLLGLPEKKKTEGAEK